MIKDMAKQLTNVTLDMEKDFIDFHSINFSIRDLNYFFLFLNLDNKWTPQFVIHEIGKGPCPFCKKEIFVRDKCSRLESNTKEIESLFQLLLHHPNIRIKASLYRQL